MKHRKILLAAGLWSLLAVGLAQESLSSTERERLLAELRARVEQEKTALEAARQLSGQVRGDVDSLRSQLDESELRLRDKAAEVEQLRQRAANKSE